MNETEHQNGQTDRKVKQKNSKRGGGIMRLLGIGREPRQKSREKKGFVEIQPTEIHMPASSNREGYTAYVLEGRENNATLEYGPIEPKIPGDYVILQYSNEIKGESPWYVLRYEDNPLRPQDSHIQGYILKDDAEGNKHVVSRTFEFAVVPNDTDDRRISLGYRLEGVASVPIHDKLEQMIVVQRDRVPNADKDIENPQQLTEMAQTMDTIDLAIQQFQLKSLDAKN